MATLMSFELKGQKQSFANWISNLSPCETPFISMIPKQSVDQTQYSWQTDRLSAAGKTAAANTGLGADTDLPVAKEGEAAAIPFMRPSIVHTNFTKIFRKAARISDTAQNIALWGRGTELGYQMEKVGMEIKRDLESYLLTSAADGKIGTSSDASECAGIQKLVAKANEADGDTGAIVNFTATATTAAANGDACFTKADIFKMTYNLYLAGSTANKIMVHPRHMATFSDMIGQVDVSKTAAVPKVTPHLHRMFEGLDSKYNSFVKSIRDPLGQVYEIIPNRHMNPLQLFFFNEKDWTQMVLRAPEKTELGRTGSMKKVMVEMEVGLRHSNPYASGLMTVAEPTTLAVQAEAPVRAARKVK